MARVADRRVLYLAQAPEDVYELIRSRVPSGVELVTLEEDSLPERLEKLRECEVVIVSSIPLAGDLIRAAERLRLVHHQGVGYHDTVDWELLRERGIPLALTPEGTTVSVAEHAALLLLAACRRLAFADAELRAGRWHGNALRPQSRELARLVVGYVGMGRIGQAVAARLRPFTGGGIYADVRPLPPERERELGLRRVSLDDLLAEADAVTLHLPLTPVTRRLIDARAIARMKRGAFLVNTSRGGIVDEAALCDALEEGRLAGAGLDVFESEPLPAASRLARLRNVVLTPHIAAGTRDALLEKMGAVFANIERFYRGEPLRNRVG